jgi:hypothetical protein
MSMRHTTLTEVAVPSPLSKSRVRPKVSYENLREIVSRQTEVQLPPLKPARTTAAVILMPRRNSHPRHGKANCTLLAQPHQKDHSICPISSGELKPIQAAQTSDYSHHFPIRLTAFTQNLRSYYLSSLLHEQKPNVSVTQSCIQQLLWVFIRNQSP